MSDFQGTRARVRTLRLAVAAVTVATLIGLLGGCSVDELPDQPAVARADPSQAISNPAVELRQSRAFEVGITPGWSILLMPEPRLNRTLDAFQTMGMQWLRIDLDWGSIEGTSGRYDWSLPDRVIAAAGARGMKVMPILTAAPKWASGRSGKYPPRHAPDFARFAAAAAKRYADKGVVAWEIWNEANLKDFWQPYPAPARYAELLIAASSAIKRIDPNATVLTTGMGPARITRKHGHVNAEDFLRALYRNGARDSFDGVAFHPYTYPGFPSLGTEGNAFHRLKGLRQIMVANGDQAKRIWLTEFGAPTGTDPMAVSQSRQAGILTSGIRTARALPWIELLMIYGGVDQGRRRANREDNFGMLTVDFNPKKSYRAVSRAIKHG